MCCRCCSVRQQKLWVFSIGGILTALGVALIVGWPTWSDQLIESRLPLSPDSFIFNKWVVTPMPLYLTFYLYNWTNPEEVNNPNVKPNFDELGPYTFRDYKVKKDLIWNDINNTVTYYGQRTWWFAPEKSNGSLEDIITTPHLPSVVIARNAATIHPIFQKILNFVLKREGGSVTMTATAIDWMFHGIYDDILDFAERLHSPLVPLYENNFAWFYKRNNSKEAEGTFTIHTGRGDLSQMGDLKMWNGSDHTKYWQGTCGKVNGSTGELWAPGKKWNDPVSIFISDAGRFINVFAKKNVTYRGIKARRYESTDQTFDNGYIAPDTECFCVKGNVCPKNGVIDFSKKAFTAPTYISHRHFYMTDPMYRENTTVFNPDPEKHGIHIIIEPKWGIPLDVNGQVLLSLFVEQQKHTDLFRNVAHNFYAPLLDMQMKVEIDDDLLRQVKLIMNIGNIGQYIGIALTVIGLIMIAIGLYVTITHKWKGDFDHRKSPKDVPTETPADGCKNDEQISVETN